MVEGKDERKGSKRGTEPFPALKAKGEEKARARGARAADWVRWFP